MSATGTAESIAFEIIDQGRVSERAIAGKHPPDTAHEVGPVERRGTSQLHNYFKKRAAIKGC
jgi:hypothetical protein